MCLKNYAWMNKVDGSNGVLVVQFTMLSRMAFSISPCFNSLIVIKS